MLARVIGHFLDLLKRFRVFDGMTGDEAIYVVNEVECKFSGESTQAEMGYVGIMPRALDRPLRLVSHVHAL